MKFWPWVSRRMYDSLYESYQDLEADRNACEASSLEYEKQAMLNHNRMVARQRERDKARDEVNDLLSERETWVSKEKYAHLEKELTHEMNTMAKVIGDRDQAKDELDSLTAEFHSLSEERDRLEMELAERTRYELEATVSESTQGVNRTPCFRFLIRERGHKKILAMSDVDGEKDRHAIRETLDKLERGTIQIIKKER